MWSNFSLKQRQPGSALGCDRKLIILPPSPQQPGSLFHSLIDFPSCLPHSNAQSCTHFPCKKELSSNSGGICLEDWPPPICLTPGLSGTWCSPLCSLLFIMAGCSSCGLLPVDLSQNCQLLMSVIYHIRNEHSHTWISKSTAMTREVAERSRYPLTEGSSDCNFCLKLWDLGCVCVLMYCLTSHKNLCLQCSPASQ